MSCCPAGVTLQPLWNIPRGALAQQCPERLAAALHPPAQPSRVRTGVPPRSADTATVPLAVRGRGDVPQCPTGRLVPL